MTQQYDSFPKKEFKTSMDYKAGQIKRFQDDKQESMRLFSSGRDAVLMVTSLYPDLHKQMTVPAREKFSKNKILEWRKFFYTEIYGHNESFYQSNNDAF
jgi:hypothetical protein